MARKSTDENHRQAHVTLRLVKFVAFSFWPSKLFYVTLLLRKGITCCVLWKRFLKKKNKSRAELFDYGVANVMSKVTHILYGVHGVDTMFMLC